MSFRMVCPKCGSATYNVERDNRAYSHRNETFQVVFSCRCGKQMFGDAVLHEYDRQRAAWVAAGGDDSLEEPSLDPVARRWHQLNRQRYSTQRHYLLEQQREARIAQQMRSNHRAKNKGRGYVADAYGLTGAPRPTRVVRPSSLPKPASGAQPPASLPGSEVAGFGVAKTTPPNKKTASGSAKASKQRKSPAKRTASSPRTKKPKGARPGKKVATKRAKTVPTSAKAASSSATGQPEAKTSAGTAPTHHSSPDASASNELIAIQDRCGWRDCINERRPRSKYCSRACSNKNARERYKLRKQRGEAPANP